MNSIKVLKFLPLLVVMGFFISCEKDEVEDIQWTNTPVDGTHNGHEYVDLGLPSGTKWATANIGATMNDSSINVVGRGLFFAWGEVIYYNDTIEGYSSSWKGLKNVNYIPECLICEGKGVIGTSTRCTKCKGSGLNKKTTYNWVYYKWGTGSNILLKYNTKNRQSFLDNDTINEYGKIDGRNTLEMEDDAARMMWGGSWRMPTYEETQELIDNCYWIWTDAYNGTRCPGYIVFRAKDEHKGKIVKRGYKPAEGYTLNDKHIFLRAGGFRKGETLFNAGANGYFWTSNINSNSPVYAFSLDLNSSRVVLGGFNRTNARAIRPVLR